MTPIAGGTGPGPEPGPGREPAAPAAGGRRRWRGPAAAGRGLWRALVLLGRGVWRGLVAVGHGGRAVRHAITWVLRWSAGEDDLEGRRRRRLVLTGLAWAVAFVLACIGFGTSYSGEVYDIRALGLGLSPFIGAAAGLPFGLIAWRPVAGWAVSVSLAFLMAVALPVADGDPWPWLVVHGLAMLALLFAVCARETTQRAIGAWLVTGGLFFWGVPGDIAVGWFVGVSVVAAMGMLIGRLARTNRALARQERVAGREKERRVILEERARIARDLHDIVAHHMSLVVVQAETAPYRVPDLGEGARAELESISASARSALAETRALLNVLRREDEEAEHAPQPGLERLDELVDGARRAGVPLEVSAPDDLGGLRPGTSLAAYRIVQEALANVSRHAPGAPVRLDVARDAATLRLHVVNGPVPGRPARLADGTPGHGITGMRERAGAVGGTLATGPTADGGFAVSATLPLGAEGGGAG